MKLYSSASLIAVFLAIFWVFGLMLALDRVRPDETLVVPSLQLARDYEIDRVVVKRTEKKTPEEYSFTRGEGNQWTMNQNGQNVKVEGSRITKIIDQIRDAKRDDETTVSNDPAAFGLQPPRATFTLTGKPRKSRDEKKEPAPTGPERDWTLLVGNDSVDKKFVYVATPERPNRVFAVRRKTLDEVFFKNANDLRSKQIFGFNELTVQSFDLKSASGEFDVKKTPSGAWLILKPNLGYADFEGPPAPKDAAPLARPAEGGIKGLIGAIASLRVDSDDDFVAPSEGAIQKYDLVSGKETLSIQVASGSATSASVETLLVGRLDGDFYYARMAKDDGVFKVRKDLFDPILAALKAPADLRSRDLAPISLKECDAMTVTQGKDEAHFLLGGDPKGWFVSLGASPQTRANNTAVENLLGGLQGRRDVVAFKDVSDAEAAKVDQELGFDQPQAVASVYLQGVDEKTNKLKKDAKAAATWIFGKTEEDKVWVKRTMPDGPAARFSINKSALEKIVPREGLIGFAETNLPRLNVRDVVRMELDRGDKSVTLERKGDRWVLKDATGESPADLKKAEDFARKFGDASVRRWVRKLDAKDDLEQYGLKTPGLKLTLTMKQDGLTAETLTSALGQLGSAMSDPTLQALGAAWGNLQLGGEKVVIKFGKEATEKDDAGTVFVQHSKTDRLSVAPVGLANALRDADFRDRMTVLMPEVRVAAAMVGAAFGDPTAGLLSASPLSTLQLGRSDASKVRDLRITVRTAYELRTFTFSRKDGAWVDQSGLKEFQVDGDHVDEVAKLVAQLDFNRVVQLDGGPKAEQKLTAKDATVVIDAVPGDLRPPMTLTIGASFEGGAYYAQVSTWPGAVFLIRADRIQPMLGGVGYFAKERTN